MKQNIKINNDLRCQMILDKLEKGENVSSKNLSKEFKVSQMTIRRDFHILEDMGLIDLYYGGAKLRKDRLMITKVSNRDVSKDSGKIAIAKKACSFLNNEDTIFLDAGSTVLQMIRYIPDIHLKVVTNSMPIIEQLSMNTKIDLVVVPGLFNRKVEGMIDIGALEYLSKIHVDKAFISAYGFDLNFGVSANDEIESRIKAMMCKNTKESFLLVDYKKFNKTGPFLQNKLNDYNHILTNSLIGLDNINKIKKINKDVVLCD